MLCLIIMCNVAALTFYATIYEDICCICNKSSEKHVLGTASTAGSLCSFDMSVRTSRPGLAQVTIYNHNGLIKNNLTLFVLYASVVLVHQSCSSFIVLNKKCFIVILFHLNQVIYDHVKGLFTHLVGVSCALKQRGYSSQMVSCSFI